MAVWPGAPLAPEMNEIRTVLPEPSKNHFFSGVWCVCVFFLMSPVTSGSELRREIVYFREACIQMLALTLPSFLNNFI